MGAVYLPINPHHPNQYIEKIINQVNPRLVLTKDSIAKSRIPDHIQIINLTHLSFSPELNIEGAKENFDAVAAIIFTSGSTGNPKGVLLSNRNISHLAGQTHALCDIRSDDIFCNFARSTFSISLFDLLVPITFGASVRFIDREEILDIDKVIYHLKKSSVMHAGPALLTSIFRHLEKNNKLEELTHMRHVSTGGDIVHASVRSKMSLLFPNAELFVFYGSTEITCMGTFYKFNESPIASDSRLNCPVVGEAFPDMKASLHTESGQIIDPANTNDVGEIAFAGAGVSLGYFNNPEETRIKFSETESSYFSNTEISQIVRSYKTGDFGRWLPGGLLEILGRKDYQVQVRGVRVELSAIENRLIELGFATQCVVLLRPFHQSETESTGEQTVKAQDRILVAFIVPNPTGQGRVDPSLISEMLSKEFPSEMIPSAYHYLERMPLNINGKLDRRQLLTIDLSSDASSDEAMSEVESKIASIFCRELRRSRIGLHDNFFSIGGHSLKAMLLVSQLERILGIKISLSEFFKDPTVSGISRTLSDLQTSLLNDEKYIELPCTPIPLGTIEQSKPNIFLLAGCDIYRNLAKKLDSDWSVLSLVSEKEVIPIQSKSHYPDFSVDQLAEDYYQAITRYQTSGDYTILGHSFGGLVGYQLANKLRADGKKVRALILIDSLLPEWSLSTRFRIMQFLRIFRTNPIVLLRFLFARLATFQTDRRQRVSSLASSIRQSEEIELLEQDTSDKNISHLDAIRIHLKQNASINFIKNLNSKYPSALLILSRKRFLRNPLHGRRLTWNRYIKKLDIVWIDSEHSDLIKDEVATDTIRKELLRIQSSPEESKETGYS